MRRILQRGIEAALREWWLTNTVAWIGVIALALWLDGWFS